MATGYVATRGIKCGLSQADYQLRPQFFPWVPLRDPTAIGPDARGQAPSTGVHLSTCMEGESYESIPTRKEVRQKGLGLDSFGTAGSRRAMGVTTNAVSS